jgi:hypothetical protein
MIVPENVKTLELSSSSIWIGDDGIMYSVPRKDAPTEQTKEQIAADMDMLRKFLGNQKMCMVLEANPASKPPSKEMRDYIAEEINSITKAMAIVTNSPLSRMVANLFFSFKPPSYPVKMFGNENDARNWVKQFQKT